MDKYEYQLRLEQLKKYYKEENYEEAGKIANGIDWRRVKDWGTLAMVINIYDEINQLEDAKNVCIIAYNRRLGGRRLVYKLAELLIRLNDLSEAQEVYDEFVSMAPNDISRYTLLYNLNVAKGAGVEKLISILNEYKTYDRDENCLYELACLYEKAGMIEKAMEECDEIILWFNGGDYFESALRLKKRYDALTHNQKMMLERMDSLRENPNYVKKQTITIELPQGVLNAADIVRAATGEINTNAVKDAEKKSEPLPKERTAEVEGAVVEKEMYSVRETNPVTKGSKPEYVKRELTSPSQVKPIKPDFMQGIDMSPKVEPLPQVEKYVLEPVIQKESVGAETTEEVQPEKVIQEVIPATLTEELSEEAITVVEDANLEEDRYIGQMPLRPGEEYNNINNTVKIPIPDYSCYDTVNIQKEIAENIKPYIDSLEEQETDTKEVSQVKMGDIINNEDGVFRVMPDTKRIIMPGVNYKLVEVSEEELAQIKAQEELNKENEVEKEVAYTLEEIEDSIEEEFVPIAEEVKEEADVLVEPEEELAASTEPESPDANEELIFVDESENGEELENSEEKAEYITEELELVEDIQEEMPDSETEELEVIEDDVFLMDTKEIFPVEKEREISVKDLAAAIEASYHSESNGDEEKVVAPKIVVAEDENEEAEQEDIRESMMHTEDITAAIEESLSKVDEHNNVVSTIFEATIEDSHEEEQYDKKYEKLFAEYFSKYCNLKGMKKQICNVFDNMKNVKRDGTSKKGNLVVTGNQSLDKVELAIAFVKAYNVIFPENKHRIAKTNAESLNKRGIELAMNKLKGSALIIEDASLLSTERVNELIKIMSSETENMLVILIDTESRIIKFLGSNAKFSAYFDNLIEIRKYNVNELVEVAKDYAAKKKATINDKALLKLYLVLDKLNTGQDTSDVKMVEQVIDKAIANSEERNSKGILAFIKKNQSKDGIKVLKESDIPDRLNSEEDQEETK